MQWEYKNARSPSYLDNGVRQPHAWSSVAVEGWLDDHGRDHWELVTIFPDLANGSLVAFFRRPRVTSTLDG